jgi:ADP-ribose pyrophosphatase
VVHGGGVGVVPYHEGRVMLVRQFRIAVGHRVLELPAGRLEPGDDPAERARREVEEEIGWRIGRLVKVAAAYVAPGMSNQIDHVYLGFDLEPCGGQRLEHDERIEVVELPLEDALAEVQACRIDDMKTVLGLLALWRHLALAEARP